MYQFCESCQVMAAEKSFESCWYCGEPWTRTFVTLESAYKKPARRFIPVTFNAA